MKFGLLFRPQDPPNAEHIGQRWQEILAAGQAAEEAGWDGLFVPEHHMMPDAYLPSPWAPLGALAALTERVDIGTTVHLLPFEHPVHVAEHSAMVDVLSGGRLKLGVGLGAFPPEFELLRAELQDAGLALRGVDRDPAAAVGGGDARPRGQALQGQGQPHAAAAVARAVDGRDVRAGHPPRRALRLPVAHRPAAQHRRHEGVEGHLRRRGRGVRHDRQAADGAAARRLGRGLDGRRRARLVALHPLRALVLLLPDPALGARPRAVPRRA